MSTLKAARADNFYYPPDADESYRKQRQRMKKTQKKPRSQGISLKYGRGTEEGADTYDIWKSGTRGPVIRFEMPFKVICLGCGAYIAKGVRFDAERKVVGKYYSTNIYAFRMSCLKCHTRIVIQTDPENTDYLCKEGVRKKIETKDPDDPETITVGYDLDEKQMRSSNALFLLEQQAELELKLKEPTGTTYEGAKIVDLSKDAEKHAGKSEAMLVQENLHGKREGRGDLTVSSYKSQKGEIIPSLLLPHVEKDEIINEEKRLTYLQDLSNTRSADDYLANSALRRRFRKEKKAFEIQDAKDQILKNNFNLPLLDASKEDADVSKNITFLSQSSKIKSHFKRLVKTTGDIFSRSSVKSASTISIPDTLKDKRRKLQLVKFIESRARRR